MTEPHDHSPVRFIPRAVDGGLIPGEFFRCAECSEPMYRVTFGDDTSKKRHVYVVEVEAIECGCVPGVKWCHRHCCPDCTDGFGTVQCEGHAAEDSFWKHAEEAAARTVHPSGRDR